MRKIPSSTATLRCAVFAIFNTGNQYECLQSRIAKGQRYTSSKPPSQMTAKEFSWLRKFRLR